MENWFQFPPPQEMRPNDSVRGDIGTDDLQDADDPDAPGAWVPPQHTPPPRKMATDIPPVLDEDAKLTDGQPWFEVLPFKGPFQSKAIFEKASATYNAICDFCSFLRCYIRQERMENCVEQLNQLTAQRRFQAPQNPNDDDRNLFQRVLSALINNMNNNITVSHTDLVTLYNQIIPHGVQLPFCVKHERKRYSWFVPVDNQNTIYESCLHFDKDLADKVYAACAMYTDARSPFVVPNSRLAPDPYYAVDNMLWLVIHLLKHRGGRHVETGERMLIRQDHEFVLNALKQLVESLKGRMPVTTNPPFFPR